MGKNGKPTLLGARTLLGAPGIATNGAFLPTRSFERGFVSTQCIASTAGTCFAPRQETIIEQLKLFIKQRGAPKAKMIQVAPKLNKHQTTRARTKQTC